MQDRPVEKRLSEAEGPVKIALTGRISSGKSAALSMFARRGAAVLSTDDVVHRLLEDDTVRRQVSDGLGLSHVPAGSRGRKELADAVFNDEDRLEELQQVLFPLVGRRVGQWFQDQARAGAQVAVVEVPMLLEAGMEGMFDYVILIRAPESVRLRRCEQTLGPGEFQRRNARQMPDEDREPSCHAVFDNRGSLEDLDAFVGGIMEMAQVDGG